MFTKLFVNFQDIQELLQGRLPVPKRKHFGFVVQEYKVLQSVTFQDMLLFPSTVVCIILYSDEMVVKLY